MKKKNTEQSGEQTVRQKRFWQTFTAVLMVVLLCLFFVLHYLANRPIELKIGLFSGGTWGLPSGRSYDIFDEAIERFEQDNPRVQISYRSGTMREDYSEWLAEQMLKGEQPDVFLILDEDFSLLSSIGALKDLDDFIRDDPTFSRDAYFQSALASASWQGQQFSLPFEIAPTIMMVNQSILEKEEIPLPNADWTWDEFYDICQAVSRDVDGDGQLDQFGQYGYSWTDAAVANGAQIFNDSGKTSTINSPEMVEALTFVRKLNALNVGKVATSDDFAKGNVAFRSYLFADYRAYTPYPYNIIRFSDFSWSALPMPAGPEGGNVTVLDTLRIGMSEQSKHSEVAWEFLKLLCYNEQTQLDVFRYSYGVSPLRAVTKSEAASKYLSRDMPGGVNFIDMTLLSNVVDSAVEHPKFRKYRSAMDLADSGAVQIVYGQSNVRDSLAVLQKEINDFLLR